MTDVGSALGAGDAGPSLALAGVRMLLLLLLLGASALAWLRWQRRSPHGGRRRLEIQDRLFLSRGSSVVLLRVDDQRLLIGVTAEGSRLLRALPPQPAEAATPQRPSPAPDVRQRFARLLSLAGNRR